MDEYYEPWENSVLYEDEIIEEPVTSLLQIYKFCLEPTLHEVLPYICKLILLNFVFRLCTQTRPVPQYLCHTISAICGVIVLYSIIRSSIFYISFFILFCFILLNITIILSLKYWPYYLSFLCTTYLIISEFYFPTLEAWSECRGMHMIVTMKVISLAFDMKKGTIKSLPNAIEFAGYMFCPSNCLFGPWISFNTYKAVFSPKFPVIDIKSLLLIFSTTLKSIAFLTLSNCWLYYLIPQIWRWLVAYQEAFSFRASHYFISYLSEAAMLVGGFGHASVKKKKESSWNFEVTRPLVMEFPRSLVQVVVFWNIQMHIWLKNYVFLVCKPMGNFFAVIMTYVISSLLHGFNLKLAAVLLSLGFYTFIEFKLRYKLSVIFDACIAANPCKKCEHLYKTNIYVWLVNFMFSAIAVFHLAYLGCLLENTTDINENEPVFLKWQQLNFASHIFTVFLFVIYKLI